MSTTVLSVKISFYPTYYGGVHGFTKKVVKMPIGIAHYYTHDHTEAFRNINNPFIML
jgi:hypothetical protein